MKRKNNLLRLFGIAAMVHALSPYFGGPDVVDLSFTQGRKYYGKVLKSIQKFPNTAPIIDKNMSLRRHK